METGTRAKKTMVVLGISALGGVVGGGLSMFFWSWTFIGGYQIFFAQGNWGGAAFCYEQPSLCFWTALAFALIGVVAGIGAANLRFSALSLHDQAKAKRRNDLALGIFLFAALPALPLLAGLILLIAVIRGVVKLALLIHEMTKREKTFL